MRKQRGQSAVEFALVAPMIFLMVFGAIYGGIMFLQFMDCSNAARTIARQVAVTSAQTTDDTESPREKLFVSYNNEKDLGTIGVYNIKRYVYLLDEDGERITASSGSNSGASSESNSGASSESNSGASSESNSGASSTELPDPVYDDSNAKQVEVLFLFDHGHDFPFGFPPRSFASSYQMKLEDN